MVMLEELIKSQVFTSGTTVPKFHTHELKSNETVIACYLPFLHLKRYNVVFDCAQYTNCNFSQNCTLDTPYTQENTVYFHTDFT